MPTNKIEGTPLTDTEILDLLILAARVSIGTVEQKAIDLIAYFEKRAAENAKRAEKPMPPDRTREWYLAKVDTYQRCADKLRAALPETRLPSEEKN